MQSFGPILRYSDSGKVWSSAFLNRVTPRYFGAVVWHLCILQSDLAFNPGNPSLGPLAWASIMEPLWASCWRLDSGTNLAFFCRVLVRVKWSRAWEASRLDLEYRGAQWKLVAPWGCLCLIYLYSYAVHRRACPRGQVGVRSNPQGLTHPILTHTKILYKLTVAPFPPFKKGSQTFKTYPPTHVYHYLGFTEVTSLRMERSPAFSLSCCLSFMKILFCGCRYRSLKSQSLWALIMLSGM